VNTEHNAISCVGRGEHGLADFIQLHDGSRYYSRNVLAADGVKHAFSDLLSRDLGVDIVYKPATEQVRHRYHASVQLTLLGNAKEPIPFDDSLADTRELEHLKRFHWDEPYLPMGQAMTNENEAKFHFGGEIPSWIYEQPFIERKGLLRDWASFYIARDYGVDPNALVYRKSNKTPQKELLHAQCFNIDLQVCQTPIVSLSHGVFSQIGDARRNPLYQMEHGVNDAVTGAIAFVRLIADKTFNRADYVKSLQQLDDAFSAKWLRDYEEIFIFLVAKNVSDVDKWTYPEITLTLLNNMYLFLSILDKEDFAISGTEFNALLASKYLTSSPDAFQMMRQLAIKHAPFDHDMVKAMIVYLSQKSFSDERSVEEHVASIYALSRDQKDIKPTSFISTTTAREQMNNLRKDNDSQEEPLAPHVPK